MYGLWGSEGDSPSEATDAHHPNPLGLRNLPFIVDDCSQQEGHGGIDKKLTNKKAACGLSAKNMLELRSNDRSSKYGG